MNLSLWSRRPWTLLVFLTLAQAAYANYRTDEEGSFAGAAELYRRSPADRLEALKAFQRFIKQFDASPMASEARFAIGEIQFSFGVDVLYFDADFAKDPLAAPLPPAALSRFAEAEQAYRAALKNAPDTTLRHTLLHRLGELSYNRRDWSGAIRHFGEVAASTQSSYATPWSLLGLVFAHAAEDNWKESEARLQFLDRNYPIHMKDPLAALARGIIAMSSGRHGEAERWLNKAQTPQARFLLGRNYLLWDKPLLAASAFNNLNNESPPLDLKELSQFQLGEAFMLSKDFVAAAGKYETFASEFPSSRLKAASLFRLAATLFQSKAYDQARSAFESMISQFPRDYYAPLARVFIAESHWAAGKTQEALEIYETLASGASANLRPWALYRYAWLQKETGDARSALKTFQSFIDLYPKSKLLPQALLIVGNTLAELGEVQKAFPYFERILDIAPNTPIGDQALFLMIKHQHALNNHGLILTSYQYLLKQLSPTASKWHTFSYLLVADSYLRVGKIRQARNVYQALLDSRAGGAAPIYATDGLAWCDQLSGNAKEAIINRQKIRTMLRMETSTSTLAHLNDLGLADSFYAQRDYADAYDLYVKFAQENADLPASATALNRAADALYHQKFYSQAVETWQKLASGYPSSPEAGKASLKMADTLFRMGKFDQARSAYEKIQASSSAESSGQAAFIAVRMAQIAFFLKDPDRSLALIEEAIARYPNAPEISDALDLAESIFEKTPDDVFKAFMSKIVSANAKGPASAQARFLMARRLYDGKKFLEAAKEFERFSADHAGHSLFAKAQLFLARSYFELNDHAKAIPVFERYCQSYPKSEDAPATLFQLGVSHYQLKDYQKAAASYQRMIAQYPKSENLGAARFNLALSLQAAEELEKARAAYEEFIRHSSELDQTLPALWSIVDIQQKEGALKAAIETLKRIVTLAKRRPEQLEAAYKIGDIHRTIGNEEAAIKTWEVVWRQKPANHPYRLQAIIDLAAIYEKRQNYEKAYAAYRDLALNAPTPSVAQAARQRMGQLDASRAARPKGRPANAKRRKAKKS
ncbi:MAG: tetratricopeptide repeat protein [Elusimicrobia bacterium]|nr:tetratricopeptide repeat protein [Elusimicrobiota bacterium]